MRKDGSPVIFTPTRRDLFRMGFATALAACSAPAADLVPPSPNSESTPSPIATLRSPNTSVATAPATLDPAEQRRKAVLNSVYNDWFANLKRPEQTSFAVTAILLYFDGKPDNRGIKMVWEVKNRWIKLVEVGPEAELLHFNPAAKGLSRADLENKIEWRGNTDLSYIWRQVPISGESVSQEAFERLKKAPWADGRDRFGCETKAGLTGCVNLDADTRPFPYSISSNTGLYNLVFSWPGT